MLARPLGVLDTGLTGARSAVGDTAQLLTRVRKLTQVRLVASIVIIDCPDQGLMAGPALRVSINGLYCVLSPVWSILRLKLVT